VLRQLLNDNIHVGVELLVEQVVSLEVHGTGGLGGVGVQRRRSSGRELPVLLTIAMPMSLATSK